MDFHGPVPVGANLIMEGYSDPAKNDRILDLAERIDEKSYDVLAEYLGEPAVAVHKAQGDTVEQARRLLFEQYNTLLGPVDEKALYLTTHWSEHSTPWEAIDYTVTSSWGGWAVSPAGLGADGFSHEIPCEVQSEIFNPPAIQLFVDNVRAMAETMVVHAAHRRDRDVVRRYDLGDRIGFVDGSRRVTDADGNNSPPPGGVRNPLVGVVEQTPYDVSPTDWYRDLRAVTKTEVVELSPDDLFGDLDRFATIAVTDHTDADPAALRAFAEAGGSVVLTDGALALLPRLGTFPRSAVERRFAYVGYVDRSTATRGGTAPTPADVRRTGRSAWVPAAHGARSVLELRIRTKGGHDSVRVGVRGVDHTELLADLDRRPRDMGIPRRCHRGHGRRAHGPQGIIRGHRNGRDRPRHDGRRQGTHRHLRFSATDTLRGSPALEGSGPVHRYEHRSAPADPGAHLAAGICGAAPPVKSAELHGSMAPAVLPGTGIGGTAWPGWPRC